MVLRKEGSYWILYSKKTHRVLGKFKSIKAALKRERQIQYFKKMARKRRRKKKR